ncbi:hypothetical protein [Paracoccus ravus]|nr:hypothetical protein [Paracoccus ravus]
MRLTRIATLITLLALAGCNTVAGVGEDITGVARWGQGMMGGPGY